MKPVFTCLMHSNRRLQALALVHHGYWQLTGAPAARPGRLTLAVSLCLHRTGCGRTPGIGCGHCRRPALAHRLQHPSLPLATGINLNPNPLQDTPGDLPLVGVSLTTTPATSLPRLLTVTATDRPAMDLLHKPAGTPWHYSARGRQTQIYSVHKRWSRPLSAAYSKLVAGVTALLPYMAESPAPTSPHNQPPHTTHTASVHVQCAWQLAAESAHTHCRNLPQEVPAVATWGFLAPHQ
jgi:hypothetical protein